MSAYKAYKMVALLGLATLPFTAMSQLVGPSRTITVPAAIRDNTDRFFPQINPSIGTGGRVISENEDGYHIRNNGSNSLVAGQQTNIPLITAGNKFEGIRGNGFYPPDCDASVGPNHIVAVVNTELAFYTKTGQKLFQQGLGAFFSGVVSPGILSDPKVYYDNIDNRWFVFIINPDLGGGNTSFMLLGVSDDSDPRGNWFKYKINDVWAGSGNAAWLDYPSCGFTKKGLVWSGNYFGFATGFNGVQFNVVKKAPLLMGAATTASFFQDSNVGTTQMSRTVSPTLDVVYGASVDSTTSLALQVFKNLDTTPMMAKTSLTVPTLQAPPPSRSTNGNQLDTVGGRMLNCYWRNGKMVCAHTIASNGVNVCRWYQINTNGWTGTGTTPTLFQSGEVRSQAANDTFMPSVAPNGVGDIAIVYTESGPNLTADMLVAGRKSSDPPGTMGAPLKVASSTGPYGAGRWGDYFGIDSDPADNLTFWAYAMTSTGDDWTTWVQSFKISTTGGGGGSSSTLFFTPNSLARLEGIANFGTLADAVSSDNHYFTITSILVPRSGHVASAEATFQLTKTAAQLDSLTFKGELSADNGLTCQLFGWNWAGSRYDYVGAYPLTSIDTLKTITFPTASLASFISGSKQVKLLVRAVSPVSPNKTPVQFNFRTDQILLAAEPKP